MYKTPVLIAGLGLLIGLSSPTAFAAAGSGPKARLFAKYDTNKNGVIDGDEIAALRKDFAAEPSGELGRYDTNHDGKLSDEEIAAIKAPGQGHKNGSEKKGEKKSGGKAGKKESSEAAAQSDKTEPASKPAQPDSN